MSEYLSKIVYLTEAQYASLIGGSTVNGHSYDSSALYITPTNTGGVSLSNQSTATIYLTGAASASSSALELSSATITTDGYLTATRVYNAVWNDYAEFRQSRETQAGRCVQENDDGWLTRSDKRLISGASIITDTYGYSQGATETATIPVAVAGRVLVYTTQPRENYHAGMAVCSGPNGTVDIMTRDEIRDYPDCIIGYVSEIPQYEVWGTGNVKIDKRIWVKVK